MNEESAENSAGQLFPESELPETEELTPESVFHDAAVRFLDIQISTSDTLDTRNASIISISSTVLPVTFGLLALGDREIPGRAETALIAALICYILVLVFAWLANSLSRALEYRPHLPTLREHSQVLSANVLKSWIAEEYLESTEVNKRSLLRKSRLVGAAYTALFAEAVCLSIAALWALL